MPRLPLLAAAMSVVALAQTSSAATVPYKDPNVRGSIGLCDDKGNQVTGGTLAAMPFVWKAISTVPAPDRYTDKEATTVLYYIQPRQNVDPAQWNPAQLTAASHFADPKHPVAQSTYADQGILPFTQEYPPTWNGFVQLRMYFFGIDRVGYRRTYPALDLHVSGDRWQVVDPVVKVDCATAKGRSMETDQLPAARLASPTPAPSGRSAGSSSTPAPGATAQASPTTASDDHSSSRSTTWAVLGLLALGVAAVGGGFWVVRRNRA